MEFLYYSGYLALDLFFQVCAYVEFLSLNFFFFVSFLPA